MGDSWSCISCLGVEEAPPPRRKKIDRSMIGLPQNFQHTGHIGSSDFGSSDISSVQSQMQSKGGYDEVTEVPEDVTPSGQYVGHQE
ncbi:PREDICTED: CDC42 small effector protein 2-like [Amphimedon queenslandica]|uniref:CRIB domain-containing protein n=1 Tax=Amphimedon queenslandica TaxID=400682 RepID=A0A1X7VU32_AMPQE|nr:PREDICTED: CDC42 small effector protein 2-like [Amphimedon queenslandica]|eukprot:XP_003382770.1 PREDICTED: CDC42 small effector protein 2-like [Amphimedon queenslandica]